MHQEIPARQSAGMFLMERVGQLQEQAMMQDLEWKSEGVQKFEAGDYLKLQNKESTDDLSE